MKTNDINNVHDKAYKEMFSNKEDFHEFLREFVDKNKWLLKNAYTCIYNSL